MCDEILKLSEKAKNSYNKFRLDMTEIKRVKKNQMRKNMHYTILK